MTLNDILKLDNIDITAHTKGKDCEYTSLCYDSRKVSNGSMFICLKGALADGHKYIEKAVLSGALAVVVSEQTEYEKYKEIYPDVSFILCKDTRKALAAISALFFGNPADKLFIIGITGTKGKTSTSFMTKSVLTHAGIKCGNIGTTGIYYADKYEHTENSTPESYELHRVFADMVNCGITHVVMEVSSQALMMHRTYGINFDVAVFTNISPDHIGENEHSDFEQYLDCKKLIFSQCKKAVINADSDRLSDIMQAAKNNNLDIITYSTRNQNADYFAQNISFSIDAGLSTNFEIKDLGKIHVGTPGTFSVYNALCATAVCTQAGADFNDIASGLENVSIFGRVEPVKHPKCDFAVLIDYAHNAISLESLYNSVKSYNPKRIITVFGCGGNRSKLRRYDMGKIAGTHSDLCVITSDNPRTEQLDDIINDILVGMKKTNGKYTIIKDRRQAIFHALSVAEKGDIVLLVGKGNQLYEEIGTEKIPFDEREVVKEFYND